MQQNINVLATYYLHGNAIASTFGAQSNSGLYNQNSSNMDTIIKEKVYENGYEHGGNRREYASREKANAALALGIIGTVAGVASLWGRGGGIGNLLGGSGLTSGGTSSGTPSNVSINTIGGGCFTPTSFDSYSKECEDVLALTNEMWTLKTGSMQAMYDARNVDVAEKFALYKSQIDADFGLYINNRNNIDTVNNRINNELFSLYKYTRDKDDETRKELCDLKAQIAIANAVRPYQDKLIQCEIDKAFTAGINYVDKKTCRVLEGVVTLPTTPTVTGITSYCCCSNQNAG